jgi:hypothetical protein
MSASEQSEMEPSFAFYDGNLSAIPTATRILAKQR